MGASFKHSFLLLAAGAAGGSAAAAAAVVSAACASSRPPTVLNFGRAAEPADVARAQLALVRALAAGSTAAASPQQQAQAQALPSGAALLRAVRALPGVCGDAGAAASLLRASGTLADLACATPEELCHVGGLRERARGVALADALQAPCALVLPRAATLTF
jgi:hypothetical protein